MKHITLILSCLLTVIILSACRIEDTGPSPLIRASMALVAGQEEEAGRSDDRAPGVKVALPQAKKEWTVLVYMDGDNNLSSFSTEDVKEMMETGSGSGLNIVLLWDNDPTQETGTAQNRHGYYYVEKSGAVLLKNAGEVNMGDPKTAKDFIDYAAVNFPADHYLWVWWNHGGAVDRSSRTRGVAWDDTSGGDHITELEQKEIMLHLKKKIGKKVDIVGFDACLMATAEIAYQYAVVASYLVASEQTEPGSGWDYRFLSKIRTNPAQTARTLAQSILTYYKNYYSARKEDDVTFSVFNLSYAKAFTASFDAFCRAALSGGTAGSVYRTLSRDLGMFGIYADGGSEAYYTKDLYEYLTAVRNSAKIPPAVRNAAGACMAVIRDGKFIVSEWHGAAWNDAAYGVSITLKHATDIYRSLDICGATQWDEFLNWAGFPDNDYAY